MKIFVDSNNRVSKLYGSLAEVEGCLADWTKLAAEAYVSGDRLEGDSLHLEAFMTKLELDLGRLEQNN